jgi:germination protein M
MNEKEVCKKMSQLRQWRRGAMAIMLILPLILAGCGWFGSKETGGQIDPPQIDYDLETDFVPDAESLETAALPAAGEEAPVNLYFRDGDGHVVPLGVRIPYEPGIAKKVLSYMVEDGPMEGRLPEGFSALLPRGTEVLGMDIGPEGLAVVDFSPHFADYDPQDERKMLEAVTWALTGFDTIDAVQIWINGTPLKEMPKNGTPLDEPLTRAMGINLELDPGVNPSVATPATLYFREQNGDGLLYYVPVTRLIRHTDNVPLAVVHELLEGPLGDTGLHPVLSSATEVLNVEVHQDTVLVNFGANLLEDDLYPVTEDALQAVVMSLTEQTGKPKVQIMVEGKAGVPIGESTVFSRPVQKPAHINAFTI